MIASIDPLKSGFALDDPSDPRHAYMTSIKKRFGELLHKASVMLRSQSEENILDAVLMLVSIMTRRIIRSLIIVRYAPFARICSSMVTVVIGKLDLVLQLQS